VTLPKEVARGWPYPILIALAEELEHAGRLLKTPGVDPDFARRVMLRTLFSALDSYAYVLSERALSIAESSGIVFSKSALEVLREGKEKANPDGTVGWQPQFNATSKHLRTAITSFAEACGSTSPLRTGDVPEDFKMVEKVRHRLTHPRKVSHFGIAADEAKAVAEVGRWLKEIVPWANAEEQKQLGKFAGSHAATPLSERQIEKLKRESPSK
jgi:hypothetical protein